MQSEIFSAFRKHIPAKVQRYLEDLGIFCSPAFTERAQTITATFRFHDKTLVISIGFHQAGSQDGIGVYLDTRSGRKWLRSEVRKYSSHDVPVYGYSVAEMNAQFDRMIKDMKLYFEKYLLLR